MSTSIEAENLEDPEFAWGKKRGVGGKNKGVRFYETFTYDEEDYALYDNVFMYKAGEPEPYIGKIVKIWENGDKSKKVKIQWFFRPREISNFLGDTAVRGNELFFASGDGIGLSNICSLEAIAGKCNIVCISKDGRNPQPSAEELQMDHYVFYRTFDVKSRTISDHMDDKVGGIEVQYVFNRTKSPGATDARNLNLTDKDEEKNVTACGETSKDAGKNSLQLLNNVKPKENDDHMLGKEDTNAKEMAVKQGTLHGDSLGVCVKSSKIQVNLEERVKRDAINVGDLDGTQSKKAELDGTNVTLEVKDLKSVQSPENNAAHMLVGAKSKSEFNKNLDGSEKDVKLALKPGKDFQGSGQAAKFKKNLIVSTKGMLKRSADLSKEKSNTRNDADHGNYDTELAEESVSLGSPPTKKIKFDDSVKNLGDPKNNNVEKMNELKNSTTLAAYNNTPKLKHSDGASKELLEGGPSKKETGKPSKSTLPNSTIKERVGDIGKVESRIPSKSTLPNSTIKERVGDIGKVESRIFEVTRRPIVEKSNWMKFSWESKMKGAHDKGTLILVQNLDPEYTSEEVEDIIFHAFKEECAAKIVQHTATSNPYSGQAFVVLNSREAVDRIVKRLDDGCLMLPNQRPLVVRTVDFPKFLQKQTLVGHLTIDMPRRQTNRDMKEAVATSHYSQNNTIEYEMAMAWCLLQARSDKWWSMLYEQHRREMQKLANILKSKTESGK